MFVVPEGAEERAVRRAIPSARILVTKPGQACVEAIRDDLDPADRYVIVGTCGGLGGLSVPALAVCTSVVDSCGECALDSGFTRALLDALPEAVAVRGYTANRVITRVAEKHALGTRFGAQVVDMESTHLVRALRRRGLTCAALRCVSDDASFDLPAIEHAIAPDGTRRADIVAEAFERAPLAADRLVGGIRLALRTLSVALARLEANAWEAHATITTPSVGRLN